MVDDGQELIFPFADFKDGSAEQGSVAGVETFIQIPGLPVNGIFELLTAKLGRIVPAEPVRAAVRAP